jgi:hypothetical protein
MQKLTLKKRNLYLNRMIAFQDTEMISHHRHSALRQVQSHEADGPALAGNWY